MPKSKTTLSTDRQVLALKAGDKQFEKSVAGARGLIVRVFPTGTKAWELRYVAADGKRRRMPLGEYPGLGLADAINKAAALRVTVVDGKDPAAERIAERRRARTGETMQELADAYFEAAEKGLHGGRGRPKRASTIAVEKTRFNLHIAPEFGATRFRQIGRSDIRQFMRASAAGGLAPDSVASVGRTLSAILSFAVHEERLDANPAAGLTQPLALRQRDRRFADEALVKIWKSLTTPLPEGYQKQPRKVAAGSAKRGPADPAISLALRLALLTLTRRADVTGAEWGEFDFQANIWTVPAGRHKSGRPHVVPVSDDVLKILAEAAKLTGGAEAKLTDMSEGFVFPSPVRPGQHISDAAVTRALARVCKEVKVPRGSPHDFRRVGASHLTSENLGFRRFVVSKVLGHAAHDGATVTALYDRNEYLPDKRRALEAWSKLLLEIVGGKVRSSNVHAIRSGAA